MTKITPQMIDTLAKHMMVEGGMSNSEWDGHTERYRKAARERARLALFCVGIRKFGESPT